MGKRRKGIIIALIAFLLFLVTYVGNIIYHENKSLPTGFSYKGKVHHLQEDQINFLYDLTYKDGKELKKDQHIFDALYKAIDEAETFIVLDFFLFNDYYDSDLKFPALSAELMDKLIQKKQANPGIEITLITDEINTSYGSHKNKQFEKMKENGIDVLLTNVDPLRDSNPLYSSLWRLFIKGFGQEGNGKLPNAMANQAPEMTTRSYLKLLNVKANHRKTVATDKTSFVLSANPHDASANNSNIGFELKGPIIGDLLHSEQIAANLAGGKELPNIDETNAETGDLTAQVVTEGKVLDAVIESIDRTNKGDAIWMAMFYLAEPKVIDTLIEASKRGADIRLILDPNENAFGSEKTGLPNRPVARELDKKSEGHIKIRWYNTTDEQYHPKLLYIKQKEKSVIIGGSTNFTTRNMDDLNLETDIWINSKADAKISKELEQYFNRQWKNEDGEFTVDFKEYQDVLTPLQRGIYTVQKLLKFTTY